MTNLFLIIFFKTRLYAEQIVYQIQIITKSLVFNHNHKSLHRYCGRSVPPSLTSTDNLMTILFVSDSSLANEGFSANYVSINATTGRLFW